MRRNRLARLLDAGALSSQVQAIVELNAAGVTGSLYGVECLTRGPAGTPFERADVLFDYVRRKHAEVIVDRECIALALRKVRPVPDTLRLFMNIHASTLGRDPSFGSFLERQAEMAGIDLRRLTLEIVEHTGPWDHQAFLDSVRGLQARGISIALDDLGLGHSNYRMVLDVLPAYLKLDSYLVRDCSSDPTRQAILRSITRLAADIGAVVIGEGVERIEDCRAAAEAGIRHLQGFLLHRPARVEEFLETPWVQAARECGGGSVAPFMTARPASAGADATIDLRPAPPCS